MKLFITSAIILLTSLQLLANAKLDTIPQTQNIGHMSTSWDDFITPSPSEQIPMIQPPKASVTGSANLSFPIKLPDARQGFTPELSIDYSNEGGTTWLGTGWNMSLSSFTLVTRWGVPTFDSEIESEIYLLDGEQMGPVFHRAVKHERMSGRSFHMRQESDFKRITRHGSNPRNYYWEVREKDGSISYYGGTASGQDDQYTLKRPDGNIVEWLLAEKRDVYHNVIQYEYQKEAYGGGENIYPTTIYYNGNGDTRGNYRIDFQLKERTSHNN